MLPISTSWVAEITDVSQGSQLQRTQQNKL
jgi:hypothetical protein